ncbi:MAG: M23 family metallopeptidase [Vicinamibacteria bacterium]|nr:M23 family metallopeptidase [Vicinamibacteria bacterium]
MRRPAFCSPRLRRAAAGASLLALLLLPCEFVGRAAPAGAAPLLEATVLRGTIPRGGTLGSALQGALDGAQLHEIVAAARPLHDLARVATGQPWGLALRPDGLLAFTYGIDTLRTLRVERAATGWQARIVTRDVTATAATFAGTIESSLFAAVTASGGRDQLALDLAEIFAWDVDFNTELQRGDSFRLVVDELAVGDRFLRYGPIRAAEFRRGERVLRAVRFEADGRAGYYAPDGTPLRKAFLRSPLRFTRISSGFSTRRLHPVLGIRRPHLGIDYAAPTGTPVQAAADGTVLAAGWEGGFGKTVRLRHANGFETLYGHLSRIDVRRGARVTQGDRIGAVGSTGLATGPHLDYRMKRSGAWVNPLAVQLPPAEPIAAALRPVFLRQAALALAALPPPAIS